LNKYIREYNYILDIFNFAFIPLYIIYPALSKVIRDYQLLVQAYL